MEISQSHSASKTFSIQNMGSSPFYPCFCHALHELVQENTVGSRIQRLRSREHLVVGLYFCFSFSKGPWVIGTVLRFRDLQVNKRGEGPG